MTRAAAETPAWAEHPDLVAFFSSHRNRPEDLYPSERRFLPWLARQARSVLDAGCAAGGFSDVWRAYRSEIEYTGVDFSQALVEEARRSHPHARFLRGDVAEGLDLPDCAADVVAALGWLHWEERRAQALVELWRLAGRFLFFDLRLLTAGRATVRGIQVIGTSTETGQETTVPYLAEPWDELARRLLALRPARILAYGYWNAPAETVSGVDEQVCMATFVVEKASGRPDSALPLVCADLPLDWPSSLSGRADVLPPEELERLVPREGDA